MDEKIILELMDPATRKRYEAFADSMRGASLPEWANMAMSVNARRDFCKLLGTELPKEIDSVEAKIGQVISQPAYRDMYRYMLTSIPLGGESELMASQWIFPASWRGNGANDLAAYKEAYLKGFSYFFESMRDEVMNNCEPLSLSFDELNARFDEAARGQITAFLEYRYPRIEKKLQRAIKKAVVMLFVAFNSDETGAGEIYYVAKEVDGLRTGKELTAKDKKAIDEVAEAVTLIVEFWALNYFKWAARYIWNDEDNEYQYISEEEAGKNNVNYYIFNEVAALFGLFITAYHKTALAGIKSSGEEYLSTDYEALLPAFACGFEGGYNALTERISNSRYNEYYTEI